MAPRNIPPNQDHNCRDDGGQEDESAESPQRDDCSQIQSSSVRLLLVVVHRLGNIHIRRLVRSEGIRGTERRPEKKFTLAHLDVNKLSPPTHRILTLPAI